MDYMNKSEEDANNIITNIEFFKRNVKTGSQRYRKINAEICIKAVESTMQMVETIRQVTNIDLKQWVEDKEVSGYAILSSDLDDALEFDV